MRKGRKKLIFWVIMATSRYSGQRVKASEPFNDRSAALHAKARFLMLADNRKKYKNPTIIAVGKSDLQKL